MPDVHSNPTCYVNLRFPVEGAKVFLGAWLKAGREGTCTAANHPGYKPTVEQMQAVAIELGYETS